MKNSRPLITILCATNLIAVATAAWEAGIISSLRLEQAAVRQALRSALTSGLDKGRAGPVNPPDQERWELIKLRNETRDLRERLVEARASQPTGLQGLLRPLLSSGGSAPIRFRPEWKGMEAHATNTYAMAMRGVTNGTNAYLRFVSLHTAAKASLAMGRTEEARHFAEDAMILNEKYSRGSPEKANGDVVHDANVVLGRIAADEGRLTDAKRHLLAAGETSGSPVLGSFGPNMGLAKDLLERGEQATVLQYFELCRKFWGNNEKLNLWKKDVEEGRIPEFSENLIY